MGDLKVGNGEKSQEMDLEEGGKETDDVYHSTNVHSFDLKQMTLSFQDASFSTPDRGTLLFPVSGLFRGGQMIAMMGPSGSGKTTLLTMLAHKKTTKFDGTFLLNGHQVDERLFPRFTGYVPQEEHLNGNMTVRECIYFYVMLKNESTTAEEGAARAELLIEQLELEACADTCIGTDTRRGISGGQKRRVNIARAFANSPNIIFLDEPTSGLSSTDSVTVVNCLRNFADRSNTLVVCVIHQPRNSVFQLFDNLLLLSSEGQCVYQGEVDSVLDYFEKMGTPIPPFENPPDYLLDVVTTHTTEGSEHAQASDAERFATAYDANVKPIIEEEIKMLPKGPTLEEVFHVKEKKLFRRGDFSRSTLFQVKLLLSFQFKLRLRNYMEIVRRLIMYVVIGVLFGLVFLRTNKSQLLAFNRVLSMWVVIGFAAIFTMESLPRLMDERKLYKYDRMDGIYGTLPYLLSLSIALFTESSILTVIMGTISYFMIGFSDSFADYVFFLIFLVATYWVTEGVMLLLASACKDAAQANGLTVAVLGVLLVFSGLVVNPGSSPPWLSWVCWISPYWYVFQSVMVMLFRNFTFQPQDQFHSAEEVYETYGVNTDLLWWNLLITLGWAFSYRVLVVFFLRYTHNPRI